jgi:hypothetical protein
MPYVWSLYANRIASEVDRAVDNLMKSGKLFNGPRRDSMPVPAGRHFSEYGMDHDQFPCLQNIYLIQWI